MKVKLMLDKQQYNSKPNNYETGKIQNRICQDEIEIEDLAIGLCNGMTCKPAVLNGTKSSDWVQQQVFMLDFDCGTTIDKELSKCNGTGIIPAFIYTSFSHKEYDPHFRMVFVAAEVITDIGKRNKLQSALISLFDKSDKVTYDPTRIFYGGCGNEAIYPNYDARINGDDIIRKYYKEDGKTIAHTTKKKFNDKGVKVNADDSYLENIDAIRNLDVVKLQSLIMDWRKMNLPLLNKEYILLSRRGFSSKQDVYDFINSIDMCEFLGLEEGCAINCILPRHEDSSPSAYIWTADDGTNIYKCFGCGRALSIISVVEALSCSTRSKAIEFIKEVYLIELIESDWVLRQKEIFDNNLRLLYAETLMDGKSDNEKSFASEFPNINRVIKTRRSHLIDILNYFQQFISEDLRVGDTPIFFASYPQLLRICKISPNRPITISQSLTLFGLLDMLEKVEAKDIPKEYLSRAKEIAAKYNHKKLTNFYRFGEYGFHTLLDSEERAKILLENNVSVTGISKEYVLRTFGYDIADNIFPQYKEENKKGASTRSNDMTSKISLEILKIIEDRGYIRESDICTNRKTETQWKRSIQEILDTYNLVRIRATKTNKADYGIKDNIPGQSFVICKRIGDEDNE